MRLIPLLRLCFLSGLVLSIGRPEAMGQNVLSREAVDRISQTVVKVVALAGGEAEAEGSGTVVQADGRIFTNRHVVEGGDDFEIHLLDDLNEPPVPRYRARLAGYSLDVDFAVLQIDRDIEGRPVAGLDLPFLPPVEADVFRGDHTFIFGYPGIGDGFLVLTEGAVTAIRNGSMNDRRLPVWYQTDAQISPGNSGGLAVNGRGEFVGIPTSVRTEEETGGRLGGLLSAGAVLAAVDAGLVESGAVIASGGTTSPVIDGGVLDFLAEPLFGVVELRAGFTPDPHTVEMVSGGEIDVDYIGGDCTGYAAMAPDLRLRWTGDSDALRIFFRADDGGDTTLLVNRWDGSWSCNDDFSAGARDPMVILEDPRPGQYDIWVGSYHAGDFVQGTLHLTELSLTPAPADDDALDYTRSPNYGSIALAAGFLPDPHTVEVLGGGAVDADYLGGGCTGHAALAPDFRLDWTGPSDELRFFFTADDEGDATLLVRRPDGAWACNDDFDGDTWNPLVTVPNPPPGRYDIWVGSYDAGEYIRGTLHVTELSLEP